jgi:hypothetical protein
MQTLTMWMAVACLVALACSGSSDGGTDTGVNVPDAVQTDPGTDGGAPDSVQVEDPGGAEDPGVADEGQATDEGQPADDGQSTDEGRTDVLTQRPNVEWSSLPKLPPGKTFENRYAAGAARVDVTPLTPINLAGYGFCMGNQEICRLSTGVHDPMFATAVAIADTVDQELVVFVGVDSVGFFPYDADVMQARIQTRLYEELGIYFQGERLILSASHSHSSPDTTGLWGPLFGVPRDESYINLLREGAVDAAVQAVQALQDISLDWARTELANRDEDGIVQDHDMFVVRGKTDGGETLFTMTRWPGHPTVYGSSNRAVSADWVGTFRKKMDEEAGGLTVFLQGPIGSVYPDPRPTECGVEEEAFPEGYKHPDVSDTDRMRVTCTGYMVADAALAALEDTMPVAETGIRFRFREFLFHVDNGTFALLQENGPLPLPPFEPENPESVIPEEVEWVTLGDLNFLTTPGESFPAFAAAGADILENAGYTNPVVLGLSPNWIGYLLVESQWETTDLAYNQGLSPGADIDPRFREAVQAMVDEATAAE